MINPGADTPGKTADGNVSAINIAESVFCLLGGFFAAFPLFFIGEAIDGHMSIGDVSSLSLLFGFAIAGAVVGAVVGAGALIFSEEPSKRCFLLIPFPIGLLSGYVVANLVWPFLLPPQPPTANSAIYMFFAGCFLFVSSAIAIKKYEEIVKAVIIPCSAQLFFFSTAISKAVCDNVPIADEIFPLVRVSVICAIVYACHSFWIHREEAKRDYEYLVLSVPVYLAAGTAVISVACSNILGLSLLFAATVFLGLGSMSMIENYERNPLDDDGGTEKEICQDSAVRNDTAHCEKRFLDPELASIEVELSRKASLARKELDDVFAGSEISKQPFLTAIEKIEESVSRSLEAAAKYRDRNSDKDKLIANARNGVASIDELLAAFTAHEVSELCEKQEEAGAKMKEAIGRLSAYGIGE